MKSLIGKHKGETAWIVGSGPSLQHLTAYDIGVGPVITLNQSALVVENLGLPNQVYSMQKDGGNKRIKSPDNLNPNCPERQNGCGEQCGGIVRPKHATLMVHNLESLFCFDDYSPRYVFELSDFGLTQNTCSFVVAIKMAQLFGCTSFKFISFDAHVFGSKKYAHQIPEVKPHYANLNVEWITPSKKYKMAFGVMVNDLLRLDMVLRQSRIDGDMHYVKNPESATKGLNLLLDIIENEGNDVAILTHQDMYYMQGWGDQVKRQLDLLPESWVVAGIIGKDYEGRICGKFHDMRVPLHFNTSEYHTFPHPACCFDECCIIVNIKSGFRFDESIDGFDLYGTLCVLQSWEMGGTAWVIDAFAEHYCMRPFTWVPDQLFRDNYKVLHDRFEKIKNGKRLDSTAIGLPKEIIDEINEKMAFMTSA